MKASPVKLKGNDEAVNWEESVKGKGRSGKGGKEQGNGKGCNKGAALRKARRKTGGNFRPPLQGRGRQRGLR